MLGMRSTMPELSSKLVTKKKIQHYTYALEDVIGKGFSSHVYKGRDDSTGERVAVKVIEMNMIKNDIYKDLLASEIYCLKLLRNIPNIIQLKDVYSTKNNSYVICELCELGTLSNLLTKRKLSESEALRFMEQLVRGYLHLHALGIIHRDIKPANIFVQKDQLKIADFGFATFCSQKRIQEKYNIGSPLYMPPESLMKNQYSFQSDIWSLGIVFYQMLFGHAPWRANTESELLNKILQTSIQHLIPQNSLSSISVSLLRRMLDANYHTRMTPQQLSQFSFSSKSKNTTSIISPTKQKTVSKIKDDEVLISTNGTINSTSSSDLSQITKQLLAQMHMCRFVFKLIKRISESGLSTRQNQALRGSLKNYLGIKLSEIGQLEYTNSLGIQRFNEFRKTEDLAKIITLVRSYRAKYESQLGLLEDNPSSGTPNIVLGCLSQTIRNLSSNLSKVTPQNIRSHEHTIVLLDYLTTSYMLVKLSCKNNISLFASKSKIEEIVDGSNISVNYDNLLAIQSKVAALGLI